MNAANYNSLRGDDDVFALLDEMGNGGTTAKNLRPRPSAEEDPATATTKRSCAVDGGVVSNGSGDSAAEGKGIPPSSVSKDILSPPSSVLLAAHPPTNPHVEISRRRAHEKFKEGFQRLFSTVFASPTLSSSRPIAPAAAAASSSTVDVDEVWRDVPAYAIRERFQFALKVAESDRVRRNLLLQGGGGGVPLPPLGPGGEGGALGADDFSVEEIRSWIVRGRIDGTVLEPVLPSPSLWDDRHGLPSSSPPSPSPSLLEDEIKFQFRRSYRNLRGKKRWGKGVSENDSGDDEEKFFLSVFESKAFQKRVSRLHKGYRDIAAEVDAAFLKEVAKLSARLAHEEHQQQRASSKSGKRKRGNVIGASRSRAVPKIRFEDEGDCPIVTANFAGTSARINGPHYRKLRELYQRTAAVSGLSSDNFASALFSALLRYDTIEGAGLQSSIPGPVFDVLLRRYGCETECFASPFNCRHGQYCSAFPDTDGPFGSLGSFFDYDFLGGVGGRQQRLGGCFQANPPFSSDFILSMCKRMEELLSRTGVDIGNIDVDSVALPLMFVVFVPAWRESRGWISLTSSPHLARHVVLSQKRDKHYYTEGTQHRRKMTGDGGRHRVASFDTSVFFLQNAAARKVWALSDEDEGELKAAFAKNPDDELPRFPDADDASASSKKALRDVEKGKIVNEHVSAGSGTAKIRTNGNLMEKKLNRSDRKSKADGDNTNKKKISKKKKLKLVSGGKDELSILASLGILDRDTGTDGVVPPSSSVGAVKVKDGTSQGKKKKKRRKK